MLSAHTVNIHTSPEEGFAIPLSFTRGREDCHAHRADTLDFLDKLSPYQGPTSTHDFTNSYPVNPMLLDLN